MLSSISFSALPYAAANAKTDAKAERKGIGMAPEIKHHLNISSIFLLQLFFLSIIT